MPLLTTCCKQVSVTPCLSEESLKLEVLSNNDESIKANVKHHHSFNCGKIFSSLLLKHRMGSRPLASPLTISGLLTLLSKCFSTFPQGTCLLSISRQYLAMDGGYHPICALLPKSVTQSISTVRNLISSKTGLSPSTAYLSRYLRQERLLVKTMMHNSMQ